jgi:hypothetical protein
MRTKCGIGKPALWGVIEDRIGSMILFAARLAGQTATCENDLQVWATVRQSVRRAQSRVIWIEHGGNQHAFMKRSACCLFYKLPEHDYCATCPLLSENERESRLRATLG